MDSSRSPNALAFSIHHPKSTNQSPILPPLVKSTQNSLLHYMKTILPASIGSISHATLRDEDLIESFHSELEWQLRRNGAFFALPENFGERDKLNSLLGEVQDCCYDAEGNFNADCDASYFIEDLSDALGQFSPPYCYFGTHPGDGSDFGFWPDYCLIEELPCVEDSDGAISLGEDCRSVNDHGNTTVYSGDGSVILELV